MGVANERRSRSANRDAEPQAPSRSRLWGSAHGARADPARAPKDSGACERAAEAPSEPSTALRSRRER
eukprot:4752558-Pyramimonas_sp.AAC.1